MILITAGEFTAGINNNNETAQLISDLTVLHNAQPAKKIYLNSFYIDQHEITYEAFRQFKPKMKYIIQNPREPIRAVSWYEADAYCYSKEKRLPTELEWEKAARGKDERLFVWGSIFNKEYANFSKKVRPVGVMNTDTSIYEIKDMNGNVSEWTANWYQPYPKSNYKDPLFGNKVKVLRGGSFHKIDHGFIKEYAMLPYRNYAPPNDRFWDTGFRCAKSL